MCGKITGLGCAARQYNMDGTKADSTRPREKPESPTSILLVGKCLIRETGNAATLHRLRSHVERGGYECVMVDPGGDHLAHDGALLTKKSFRDLIVNRNVAAAVGIHLYRSASALLACKELGVPYLCYFGGTDINEGVEAQEKLPLMTDVAFGAQYLIAFTSAMKTVALNVWPTLKEEAIIVFPQAITVDPNKEFNFQLYIQNSKRYSMGLGCDLKSIPISEAVNITKSENNLQKTSQTAERLKINNSYPYNHIRIENDVKPNKRKRILNARLSRESLSAVTISSSSNCPSCTSFACEDTIRQVQGDYHPLVVLIAGIRPVKDVLYVAESWSKWQRETDGKGLLLLIGPVLDDQYAKKVKTQAASLRGILVADKLEPSDCQEVIRNATAFLNSSISEGMSAAILEAMALGTPVLARAIPGNAAVIDDGVNGLLFTSPETFVKQLQRLMDDPGLSCTLTARAKEYLHENHCPEVERKGFLKVLQDTISTQKGLE